MAECLDTAVTALLNSEVAEFIKDRRSARKEAHATMKRAPSGHTVHTKEARWVEARVRSYVRRSPAGGCSAEHARRAFAVLRGDMGAAEEAAAELLAATPADTDGAAAVCECARIAPTWELDDSHQMQLVNLRCCSDVEVFLATGTLADGMGDHGVDVCVRALSALLPAAGSGAPSPAAGPSAAGAAPPAAEMPPPPSSSSSSTSSAAGAASGRSVRFRESRS